MFEIPTTLILGAGTSSPYGYPVGDQLKTTIIDSLKNMLDKNSGWVVDLNINRNTVQEFITNFDRSKRPSIDSFLKNQNPDVIKIGKLAIVDLILNKESIDNLYNPNNDDWYRYFVEVLYECDDVDDFYKNIKIISYNYDRSLEHYLIEPLYHTFPNEFESIEDCYGLVKKIPILHMYGRLDPLPWEAENGRGYGQKCLSTDLLKISSNIMLVNESVDKGIINKANKLLRNSYRSYFLGMDLYRNRANIDILDLTPIREQELVITTYGLAQGFYNKIRKYFVDFKENEHNLMMGNRNQKTLTVIQEKMPF